MKNRISLVVISNSLFITLFITNILFTVNLQAQTFTGDQKQSLKGLSALLLVVEFTEPSVADDGLNKDDLERSIAARLRGSGIRLMSSTEWSAADGIPYLYVKVNTLKSDLGFYSFKIDVVLNQEIILKRDPDVSMMAETWQKGSLGHIGINRISVVRNDIMSFINVFIQDFKAVNPG
jgi:hypothetical protein